MDLNLNTSLKQEQSISPQMLQSLALLPMPIMELKEFIQSEIESNPALEIPQSEYGSESIHDDDDEYDDYSEEASDRKQQAIENTAIKGESLDDHLLRQLGLADITDTQYRIGEMLIGNLDENGFYVVPLETLFEKEKFQKEDIDFTVELVRSFDPFGVCVTDFRESLTVQAKCSGMQESDLKIFSELVNCHLEKIKEGKTGEVADALHISEEDLMTFVSILRGFTPFPGRNYDNQNEEFVIPEFSVHKKNNQLVLEMNKGNLPDLIIADDFVKLADGLCGPEAKETSSYIKSSIARAKNLINQVQMRYQTLFNCATALVDLQQDFFLNGPMFLKPMTLKDIASKINVHETTVSRLSRSKWVETDWGLVPMKSFFSQGVGLSSEEGGEVSRSVVKNHIEQILKENPKLSDQKISDRLLELGIKCARRTVSKYRSELNIDSSYSRI